MKRILVLLLLATPLSTFGQEKPKTPATLRSILLEQLQTTHDKEDWFVPVSIAIAGMTAEQAKWTPGPGSHSVGQLANHLLFWDSRALADLTGGPKPKFDGNNDETFNDFDAKQWDDTVKKLDQVLIDLEKAVEAADDKKIEENASLIAHVGAHNAYHVGQILYARKLQGSWDPSKGVK
jgi:uncharacterized damage-inducible protein DinB